MKNLLKMAVCVGMLQYSMPAMASTIAIVDVQRVVSQAVAAKKIREQIKSKRDSYQASITKEEDELRASEKKLANQRSLLSAEDFDKKRNAFKNKVIEVQRDVQTKRSKLDKAFSASMEKVRSQTVSIIHELAKKKGFSIALGKAQVLYSEEGLDITADVLKELNKRLPSVKVELKE